MISRNRINFQRLGKISSALLTYWIGVTRYFSSVTIVPAVDVIPVPPLRTVVPLVMV